MLLGLLYNIKLSGIEGIQFSLLGILTGIGLLIIPYILGKMGAGDAKLLGAVGSYIGAKGVFDHHFYSLALAGGIYALFIIILYNKNSKVFLLIFTIAVSTYWLLDNMYSFENQEDIRQRPKICYGLAIAAGTGIFYDLCGNRNRNFTFIMGGQNEIV